MNWENYNILNRYRSPEDLKSLSKEELEKLAQEVRRYIIEVTSKTGGHVGPSLGAVELTIALLKVFNPPKDAVVWDVGHQAYAWKILTDRKEKFPTLRQYGGISGFIKRGESPYDLFTVGHSSTSISAALGIRKGKDLLGKKEDFVIAVVGDGALTGGEAWEGLNNTGQLRPNRFIVVLNDNEMSISPNVGAISNYLNKVYSGKVVQEFRQRIKKLLEKRFGFGLRIMKLLEEFAKGLISPGILFEELGFNYIGVIDGHNIPLLVQTLENVKNIEGPVLLHIKTVKGKGYKPAEENPIKWHGVGPYKLETGKSSKKKKRTWSQAFGEALVELAQRDERIVAITPAMKDGSGLTEFAKKFPERFFDVGIAEQHAATFSAGLATQGLKPVLCYYSTFMQRAYDQIIHDIALQDLPVVLAIDRAGLVGEDGPTHHGVFDLSFLRCVPNMVISAPKDEVELRNLLYTALKQNSFPFAIRYPRGEVVENLLGEDKEFREIPIGSWEVLRDFNSKVVIVAVGIAVSWSLKAYELLKGNYGLEVGVVNARFVKPLDRGLLKEIAQTCEVIVTVEENTLKGGLFGAVLEELSEMDFLKKVKVKGIGIPDRFVTHGKQNLLREKLNLSPEGIVKVVVQTLKQTKTFFP
ncbi:MAG TPA: 1-deoxy-D-xylulose-5-phosphate synthase [Aquifex aeolicus]|uniref:1-deoxy-D-xylulose-5-phosphate synthase n=1 Tax=Aquifex aeolicus TaxID=63363 RepID=A0A9D1CGK4_AQUAO|nr:1-deoxy-D-xylulose-5-phosphate synthase [Aquificales bacterium]HIP98603.1 1-deoxy-D-xylulose-5-phosphate synthase [Aquifex aeolicus]HIQ26103.1 1-deoxy-D-xylulose-5-phosphate synthase [Aquifex aeolicus]